MSKNTHARYQHLLAHYLHFPAITCSDHEHFYARFVVHEHGQSDSEHGAGKPANTLYKSAGFLIFPRYRPGLTGDQASGCECNMSRYCACWDAEFKWNFCIMVVLRGVLERVRACLRDGFRLGGRNDGTTRQIDGVSGVGCPTEVGPTGAKCGYAVDGVVAARKARPLFCYAASPAKPRRPTTCTCSWLPCTLRMSL